MSSKLFAFSRPLPAPFDKAKKKVKVSSKYGDGTEATLCSTVVKAVQAYFKCKDGSAPGAVGLCGTKGVAEYKSASGPEVYHLAVYDPVGGAMLASIYNKDTEMLETYAVRNNGQDGAAIMMSMLPALMADDEFRENLDALEIQYQGGYNPFVYISSDDDIQRLTTNLFKNTTPKGSQTQDPFWDQTAAMLLKALVCYLHYEAPPDEQNFSMVMEMIRAGDVKEDNEEYQSVLDELFERLEERNPEHIALKYYRAYHSGSAKTLKSIQISLVSRLEKFNLDSLAGITQCDEMDLGQIGEKKTAVFAVIPDNDSSFNFIVGMLYTQLFQQLYYQADSVHGGRLPVHVHFVMDEFANVALPDEFDKLLSTMRSREISVSIIIQNLAQLKALFEKQWESIVGNCDEFLYLGGNEQSTHEYVSKLLGKETIDTNTYGRSRGRNGSYSTNYQLAGRELMTPDEVRMLDNQYALLFIRGERPIRDLKYDILHHPNVALTTDGSAPAYTHGEDTRSIASMAFSFDKKAVKNAEKMEAEKHEFLLYSEEELEELLDEKEKKDNEET